MDKTRFLELKRLTDIKLNHQHQGVKFQWEIYCVTAVPELISSYESLLRERDALRKACRKALRCVSTASDFRQAHEVVSEMVEILQTALKGKSTFTR